MERPCASSICSIFLQGMESNALEKSMNKSVASRFFAHTPLMICLPCYSWLSVFWVANFIDLVLNRFLFFLICISSLWAFLKFWSLAFVGFLLLNKDAIFMLSHFFITTSDSLGIFIWLLVLLVCLQLLLSCGQWWSFHICYSEDVFQISPEMNKNLFPICL